MIWGWEMIILYTIIIPTHFQPLIELREKQCWYSNYLGEPGVLQPFQGCGKPVLSAVSGHCKSLPSWPPGPQSVDKIITRKPQRIVNVPQCIM